ncbi:MAG: thioredoxin domain-containing protein [Bacteroidota bacterium]|nr:thioredoxin domain-containing protein [Bacteroidota bacterium]
MKKIMNLILVLIFLTGLGFSNSFGQESPTLYAVSFYADNCSASKSIAPKVNSLQESLKGKSVEFVKFDMSDDESIKKTRDQAGKLGLSGLVDSYSGTGFVVLADAKSKETKAVLKSSQSVNEMLATITKHL